MNPWNQIVTAAHPIGFDQPIAGALFNLGRVAITAAARAALDASGEIPTAFLARHARGDWGIIDEVYPPTEDGDSMSDENLQAIGDPSTPFLLHSAYRTAAGVEFWIATKSCPWIRTDTVIYLPARATAD